MRRLPTEDWDHVGWSYKGTYAGASPWHNPLWIRAQGQDRVPETGGVILACNHTSWWDPIILMLTVRRPVCWLAKKEMMNNRFNKWFFFDRGGCIPVDRNARNPQALTAATAALRGGRIIGIFPEGTRNVGKIGPAKAGVARLAFESGVPVIPVALLTDRFWPRGRALPNILERTYVNFGEPISLKGDPQDAAAAREATDQIMREISKLHAEAVEAREKKLPWKTP